MLGIVRLVLGPTVFDRMLAFDLIAVCGVGMMALVSVKWRTGLFLELIILFTLLGFLSTVAFVLFLRQSPDHPDDHDQGEGT
jgi:multisubunit Na+/H+ antiporter MnhF subunit